VSEYNNDRLIELESDNTRLREQLREVQTECETLKLQNRDWLAANGPGGWIDEQRKLLQETLDELSAFQRVYAGHFAGVGARIQTALKGH
jgi:hypothetical protein